MSVSETTPAGSARIEDEEWTVYPSDDELVAVQMDTGTPYFEPKDPNEIIRLYALMSEKGVIELEWVSPGRMEAKPEDDDADEKRDAKETVVKSELNEFDFDEPTPAVSLSFRKQKKVPQGQRKVASFDKIMNDITKGKSVGPTGSPSAKKDSPTKEKKQRKPKQPKTSKGAAAPPAPVTKTSPDKVTSTGGAPPSGGVGTLQVQIKQEPPGTGGGPVTPGTPTTPTPHGGPPSAPVTPGVVPGQAPQPQQMAGAGPGMRTGPGPIIGGLMGPQQPGQPQTQQHQQHHMSGHIQQQGVQQQVVSQGMMTMGTNSQPMQQQSGLQQMQQQMGGGGQQQQQQAQHPNLLKQMLVPPGGQQPHDMNGGVQGQPTGAGIGGISLAPSPMAVQIQPGQTPQSSPITSHQQIAGMQQPHAQQVGGGQQMGSAMGQQGMQTMQPQQQMMSGQQAQQLQQMSGQQQQLLIQQGPGPQQQGNAGQVLQQPMQHQSSGGLMIQTVQGVQHKMGQVQIGAGTTGGPQQQGQYNLFAVCSKINRYAERPPEAREASSLSGARHLDRLSGHIRTALPLRQPMTLSMGQMVQNGPQQSSPMQVVSPQMGQQGYQGGHPQRVVQQNTTVSTPDSIFIVRDSPAARMTPFSGVNIVGVSQDVGYGGAWFWSILQSLRRNLNQRQQHQTPPATAVEHTLVQGCPLFAQIFTLSINNAGVGLRNSGGGSGSSSLTDSAQRDHANGAPK
ncbi:hypothetical protein BIW11_02817 [Tropilaelaps mercedesae]|uniref:Uncharacterized protein n=1 Tax=Tropilaelaps mercedesae TaxID=418985 RepID=A0A1V9XX28_9ACAR|nr:hypothetical protein BIW11_02817 [Tropilaelaps mercedesae]